MEPYFTGVEVKILRVREQSNRDPGSGCSLNTAYLPSEGYKGFGNESLG